MILAVAKKNLPTLSVTLGPLGLDVENKKAGIRERNNTNDSNLTMM